MLPPAINDDLYVELFLRDISDEVRAEYLGKLFPGVRSEELDALMKIMDVFFEEEGSLIRMPVGAAVYYMALQFYQNEGSDMPSLLSNL